MSSPSWRLVLTGAAVIVLAGAGIGLAAAASAPPGQGPSGISAQATRSPGASSAPDRKLRNERLRERPEAWGARLLRIGRHLVHVEATVTDRDGNLIVIWLDHGTVSAVGNGSVTVSEAGGGSESMSTDEATIVRLGRGDGTLDDVTVGDEVFVQSRVEDGAAVAKRIVIIPARATEAPPD